MQRCGHRRECPRLTFLSIHSRKCMWPLQDSVMCSREECSAVFSRNLPSWQYFQRKPLDIGYNFALGSSSHPGGAPSLDWAWLGGERLGVCRQCGILVVLFPKSRCALGFKSPTSKLLKKKRVIVPTEMKENQSCPKTLQYGTIALLSAAEAMLFILVPIYVLSLFPGYSLANWLRAINH